MRLGPPSTCDVAQSSKTNMTRGTIRLGIMVQSSPLVWVRGSRKDCLTPKPHWSLAGGALALSSPMWIHRHLLRRASLSRRPFSQPAAAIPLDDAAAAAAAAPLFTYLPGHPKPDPRYAEIILGVPRSESGKSIAAKERKAGRVPSIVFEQENGQEGGNKRLISVRTGQIKKLVNRLGRSFFLSRLFELEVRPAFESGEVVEKVRVLPRKVNAFTAFFFLKKKLIAYDLFGMLWKTRFFLC